MVELFAAMIVAHMVADYPLQGDFLAQGKNRHTAVGKTVWPHALAAHAIIHGGFVWAITGIWWLGAAEVLAHAITDFVKCEGKIGFTTDQAIHWACKAAWAAIAVWWLA